MITNGKLAFVLEQQRSHARISLITTKWKRQFMWLPDEVESRWHWLRWIEHRTVCRPSYGPHSISLWQHEYRLAR